jgi:hypothetical protein
MKTYRFTLDLSHLMSMARNMYVDLIQIFITIGIKTYRHPKWISKKQSAFPDK